MRSQVIISSKHLFNLLRQVDFEIDGVKQVELKKGTMVIETHQGKTFPICVETKDYCTIEQGLGRWDWVSELVRNVPEQPIVLSMARDSCHVIFQY